MKTLRVITQILVLLFLACGVRVFGQGTVTFDHPWATGGIGGASLYYDRSGFSVRVDPYPPAPHDTLARIGALPPLGYPQNGTPYVAFINTLGIPEYVVLAWTNAASLGSSFLNGAPFGLASVDLADPMAPSLSPASITFNGYKDGGLLVSQTFTVGGGGSSSFQTVTFGPDFARGLLRVEIPSPRWAMDNLVWVPEPAAGSLLALGLLALALACRRPRP